MTAETPPLILTATLDPESFQFFNRLRQKHFPPERNFLAAHLTLFHHLPGDEIQTVSDVLRKVSLATIPILATFASVRFLGRGVAINVESTELIAVRRQLATAFDRWLTPQDRQKFGPHITIQNKVEPHAAKELFEEMKADFEPFDGTIAGIGLWHYLGGPWRLENDFSFTGTT